MRALIVCTLLLLWALPALAEQKSAPDGFGPIKFGMTKDEAWEAIGGEGRWESDEILLHEVGIPSFMEDHYEVRQKFVNGRAAVAIIQNKDEQIRRSLCASHLAFLLSIVQSKYSLYPANVRYRSSVSEADIYQFWFHDSSTLRVNFVRPIDDGSISEAKDSCILRIYVAPPDESLTGSF